MRETICLIKLQPSHGAVDLLRNLGAFRWENPNPDSCFYFKAAKSLLKQKRPTSSKIKKTRKKASRRGAVIIGQKSNNKNTQLESFKT